MALEWRENPYNINRHIPRGGRLKAATTFTILGQMWDWRWLFIMYTTWFKIKATPQQGCLQRSGTPAPTIPTTYHLHLLQQHKHVSSNKIQLCQFSATSINTILFYTDQDKRSRWKLQEWVQFKHLPVDDQDKIKPVYNYTPALLIQRPEWSKTNIIIVIVIIRPILYWFC